MARFLRGHRGGILGLLRVAQANEPALRSTLAQAGSPLGEADLYDIPIDDLRALLTRPPEGTPLARARGAWSPTEYLLAAVLHALQTLVWQNGGGKGPRPTPLDLDEEYRKQTQTPDRPFGRGRSVAEMAERMGM